MPPLTHATIAQIAGISRSTVSRALQNHPAIPEETRRRIQKLADKLGYRPNPLVSALMASRSRPKTDASAITIAVLTAWPPSRELAPDPALQRLLRGAFDRAAELGYHLEEFWMDEPGMTWARLTTILISRGIVALLVAPVPKLHSDLALDWSPFSIGTFANGPHLPSFHRASHSHFQGVCLAFEEVHRRGYLQPGLVLSESGALHVREQYLGGMAAIAARGIFKKPTPPLIWRENETSELKAWLKRYQPDVIIGDNLRLPANLKSVGYAVPHQIAFAALDRPTGENYAGIDQLKELIGRAAVDLIVAQVYRNERGIPEHARDIKLSGIWVDGPTVPGRV